MIHPNTRPAFAVLALALFLTACATPRPAPGPDAPHNQLRAEIADPQPAASAELPPDAAAALLPPIGLDIPRAPEHRFDIDVREVDARTFFLSLLRDSAENIVVHPSVQGTLTLSLRNVSVADVLTAVRDVYGYDVRRVPSGWQIFPAALQSRLFSVNYINLVREGRTETYVNSGQLRGGGSRNSNSSNSGDGGSNDENNNQPSTTPSSRIRTTSSNDFWAELEHSLRLIVGASADGAPADGRTVVITPHTGLVLVRAMPAELREVESFLHSLQNSVTRQVLLEAKILEVTLSDGFQAGINWAALGRPGSGKAIAGGTQIVSRNPDGTPLVIDHNTPIIGDQISSTVNSTLGGIFSLALNLNDFTAFIELLKTQGDVQVLSSPRIATMNNQKAVIKVGTDEFFVTRVSSNNTSTSTTTVITPEIEFTPFFSGIALDVTPQVDNNGEVILHIRPSVTKVVDQTKKLIVFGQEHALPTAHSTMRESDSIVRARNQQVIVIGGLMEDSQEEDRAGVPILADLPGLGHLFRNTRQARRKTELVILLKPIVVDDGSVWQNDLTNTLDRIDGRPPALR